MKVRAHGRWPPGYLIFVNLTSAKLLVAVKLEENLDGTHYYMACVNITFIRIIIEYKKGAR